MTICYVAKGVLVTETGGWTDGVEVEELELCAVDVLGAELKWLAW